MKQDGSPKDVNSPRNAFLQAIHFRHACREFDTQRWVSREDIDFILEAGRLSPSSLRLEPWRFVVVEEPELKKALQKECMGQPQVGSASAAIVILALENELAPDSKYVEAMFRRHTASDDAFRSLASFYRELAKHNDLTSWSIAQCHIAAANMMTAAAVIGVDTCPIGAFSATGVQDTLGTASGRYVVALVLAVGYRKNPPPAKHRLPMAELVEYR